jgi:hypothetical protein
LIPPIDIIRSLRNKRAYQFIIKTNTPIIGDNNTTILVNSIGKAWSQAPEGLSFITNDMITPYLPSEMKEDSIAAIKSLLDSTQVFYETDKALRVAYSLVSTCKLSQTIERAYQENTTPLEIEKYLRNAFYDLSQLEVELKRTGLTEESDSNLLRIEPTMSTSCLRPPGGGSRVKALCGGDLDIAMGGGLEEGTYTIFLGSKGEGKTWTAGCIAAANARAGRNTLFITCENSKYSISERTYPLYLQVPFFIGSFRAFSKLIVDLKIPTIQLTTLIALIKQVTIGQQPMVKLWADDFIARIQKLNWPMPILNCLNEISLPFYTSLEIIRKARENTVQGVLDVAFFPANSLKISDIERLIEESDIAYSLIVVDYLNAVQIPPNTPKHEFLGWFSNEVRRLSAQVHCATWINAQLKRGFKMFSKMTDKGGLDDEVFYEFVAESFAAVWGADYVIVMLANQTVTKASTGGYQAYDRTLILNRSRETVSGDWFSFGIDFKNGIYNIKKLSI